MESSTPTRVLLVAHQTAATPELLNAVRERSARGSCAFTLLVPAEAHGLHKVMDPEDADPAEARAVMESALPALEEAAGSEVQGMVGDASPLTAVQDAVNVVGFDEIIISTLPHTLSRWLRLDLPHKAAGLGLPVTTVTAGEGVAA